uniref:XPG N-terminal domain-containing protein n=1 Tax=viral metagenome TaxID=1070528 RepID=A0A6C0I2L5_9ZZZZ
MGIKCLNHYLSKRCSQEAIHAIHLKDLENRVVVIDASIFIYKFIGEGALVENMYLFVATLLEYNITPIFIFDGKPPPEKHQLLVERKQRKREAEEKYNLLLQNHDHDSADDKDALTALKKQFIRVKEKDLLLVKRLLDAYGVAHFVAPAEADILCAYLVATNVAYACISDDMDMFLFGCSRVIRNISLMKHTAKIYHTDLMLEELDISPRCFREILVLSGTDYNIQSNISLKDAFALYYQYKEERSDDAPSFYVWLMKEGRKGKMNCRITNFACILRTDQMFQFTHYKDLDVWTTSVQQAFDSRKKDIMKLHDILYEDGFIFV